MISDRKFWFPDSHFTADPSYILASANELGEECVVSELEKQEDKCEFVRSHAEACELEDGIVRYLELHACNTFLG